MSALVWHIYVDGACSGNPGPGGWAAIFSRDGMTEDFHLSGSEEWTTNSRMELESVRQALRYTAEGDEVYVYSDSAYVVNCFVQRWYEKWVRNGWRTSDGRPVAHRDLWEEILELVRGRRVKFVKVRGHNGVRLNELADRYAREAILRRGGGV